MNLPTNMKVTVILSRLLLAAGLLGAAALSQAQALPAKPLRIIVPYNAGGLLDAVMRRVGPPLSESIGQPVLIDNRPGGVTNIGMQACAGAPPDGSTVCFTLEDSVVYNPLLYRKLPYDPASLVPVIQLLTSRGMIVANAAAPFNGLGEMLAYAKSKPNSINWGTFGPGSAPDVYRRWINHAAGIDIVEVPYKGAASGTLNAVIGGEIHATVLPIGMVLPMIKTGRLKPIAIIGDKRWPGLPSVASLGEEKLDPGIRNVWGVYAPPGTPKPVVDRLNAEFAKALATPSIQEMLDTNTLEVVGGSAIEFSHSLNELRTNATRVFRALGIKPSDTPS